jgi:hypothetical protein
MTFFSYEKYFEKCDDFFVYELKNTIYQNIGTNNIKAQLKLTINIYFVPFQQSNKS